MIPHHEQEILRKSTKIVGLDAQRDMFIGTAALLTAALLQERHDVSSDVIGALAEVSIAVDTLIWAYGEMGVGAVRDRNLEAMLEKLADPVGIQGG